MTTNRRGFLKGSAALGAGAMLTGSGLTEFAKAWAQSSQWKPEAGAKINLMRWKRFLQAEEDSFVKMIAAFEKATGVKVNVTNESFDDIQPKASVAANTGVGPDIVWPLHSTPHLFPDKLLPLNDVADYLGKKYGSPSYLPLSGHNAVFSPHGTNISWRSQNPHRVHAPADHRER